MQSISDWSPSEVQKEKNAASDVKGISAAVCKHDFPLAAMNMFHGERLGYSDWMITHLLDLLAGPEVTRCHDISLVRQIFYPGPTSRYQIFSAKQCQYPHGTPQ